VTESTLIYDPRERPLLCPPHQ